MKDIEHRIAALDWPRIGADLDAQGCATTAPLLTPAESAALAGAYDDGARYRSRIVMAKHGFGRGEYKYFAYPLPPPVAALRSALYPRLAPVANAWAERLNASERYPADHAAFVRRCHAAGQTRPTPLILRYGAGDWNALHQDLYGEVFFPFQILTVLSRRGADYEGGEFVLMEQRPRAQSRAHVLTPPQGAFVIFPTRERPAQGRSGYHRIGMRHGVSTVTQGTRTALGVIFHDAR